MALHLDIPTRAQIAALLDARSPASTSIYLPTSPLPQDADAARIEFKTLAAEALRQADDAGLREQLDDLHDDGAFWSSLAISLAVLATPTSLKTFRLPNRLTAMVEVSDRFHVKPLLRSVTFPQAALVLALAQGSVRLIEVASEGPPSEIAVADMPTDVASAAGKASITDRTPAGRIQGSEGQKVRMRQYARQVDRALRPVLHGLGLPLILAAAEPLDGIYRSVNSYPQLAPTSIAGNPEARSDAELAAAARGILDELYAAELDDVRGLFEARAAAGRGALDLTDVARAATYGAVDVLMADIDQTVPGFVDEDSGAVTRDGADDAVNYGVVDEVARRVLQSGGRVLALRRPDIPGESGVAAILRYPV
jgi:Bacterial archaeo-eukaryotic release factor family 11